MFQLDGSGEAKIKGSNTSEDLSFVFILLSVTKEKINASSDCRVI